MAMLASLLEGPARRLMVDRTGLVGNWDFEVNYTPDRSLPGRPLTSCRPGHATSAPSRTGTPEKSS